MFLRFLYIFLPVLIWGSVNSGMALQLTENTSSSVKMRQVSHFQSEHQETAGLPAGDLLNDDLPEDEDEDEAPEPHSSRIQYDITCNLQKWPGTPAENHTCSTGSPFAPAKKRILSAASVRSQLMIWHI